MEYTRGLESTILAFQGDWNRLLLRNRVIIIGYSLRNRGTRIDNRVTGIKDFLPLILHQEHAMAHELYALQGRPFYRSEYLLSYLAALNCQNYNPSY